MPLVVQSSRAVRFRPSATGRSDRASACRVRRRSVARPMHFLRAGRPRPGWTRRFGRRRAPL